MVLMFTLVLFSCDALAEQYPAQDEETGIPTFTLSEVEDMIAQAITDYDNATMINYYNKEDVDDEVAYLEDIIYEQQDMLFMMMDVSSMLKDQGVIEREMYMEGLRPQVDQLRDAYQSYMIEEYPLYFDEDSFDFPDEFYDYTVEDWSIHVDYTSYNMVIVVNSVEVCGDICEIVTVYNQTDYVMTIAELENYFQVYLTMLYNAQ